VFAHQLCRLSGADSLGVVSSPEKGALVRELGAVDFIDRGEFVGMMRRGGESFDEEKARFKESRRVCKEVVERLGGEPDIDIAAWRDSIAKIKAWKPAALAITHFGQAPPEQLDACLEALDAQARLEADHDEQGFVAAMEQRVRDGCGEDADAMIRATPLDQLYMGLARWRAKHGD
jgi:hypothetical protein